MKKMMLTGLLFCFVVSTASAQAKNHKSKNTQKTFLKNKAKDSTVVLTSSNGYPAFAAKPEANFRIADPTINTLNARAAGAPVPQNSSGIIGSSKHSNGFAKGHILLRSTTATSSGTGYGSGAVGTGTSIQGLGVGESTLGANGKSPYAAPSLWGDKRPVYSGKSADSTNH